VTGVDEGSVSITVALSGKSRITYVDVTAAVLESIDVIPTTFGSYVAKNITKQFRAMGTYSDDTLVDITGDVIWTSDDEGVATIDEDGLATGVDVGATAITATLDDVSDDNTLTVRTHTFAYVANKDRDTLSEYVVDEDTGELHYIGYIATGDQPNSVVVN